MSEKEQLFHEICTRDNSECQCCGWFNEEHDKLWVKKLDPAGSLDPSNLVTLCTYCKNLKEELALVTVSDLKKEQRKHIYADVCRRDGFRCKRCSYTDKTMQHLWVVRRYKDGAYSDDNMVTLCFSCKERKEEVNLESDEELIDDYKECVRTQGEVQIITPTQPAVLDEEDWHLYVYGGKKNPRI